MGDVFAIDFTSEGMTAAFVSPDGMERDTAGFDLSDFLAGDSGAVDKLVGLLAAKARMSGGDLEAIVLTLPCDIDVKHERIGYFPQASWLNGQPLPALLQEVAKLPVIMTRRSIAMLSFDLVMLGLPLQSLSMGCYIDMQYDVALWHNGVPVLGHNGRAGNITHLVIPDREDQCYCGKNGCVGLYGTAHRLRQLHTMIFPDTPMEALFEQHGDHPIVLDYLKMMAYPIAMAVNFSDPDYLILGGDVLAMRAFPRSILEEEIRQAMYNPGDDGVTIAPSTVGSMASGVVCGAQYARTQLKSATDSPVPRIVL